MEKNVRSSKIVFILILLVINGVAISGKEIQFEDGFSKHRNYWTEGELINFRTTKINVTGVYENNVTDWWDVFSQGQITQLQIQKLNPTEEEVNYIVDNSLIYNEYFRKDSPEHAVILQETSFDGKVTIFSTILNRIGAALIYPEWNVWTEKLNGFESKNNVSTEEVGIYETEYIVFGETETTFWINTTQAISFLGQQNTTDDWSTTWERSVVYNKTNGWNTYYYYNWNVSGQAAGDGQIEFEFFIDGNVIKPNEPFTVPELLPCTRENQRDVPVDYQFLLFGLLLAANISLRSIRKEGG